MKRYDLMQQINARGTFLVSKLLHPASPEGGQPAHPDAVAAARHESEMVRAARRLHHGQVQHEHLRARAWQPSLSAHGIAVNALWPRTTIATAAVANLLGGDSTDARAAAQPEIMADAAHVILTRPSREFTGHFCIDDTLLWRARQADFDHYRVDPSVDLAPDFFVPEDSNPPVSLKALVRKPAG